MDKLCKVPVIRLLVGSSPRGVAHNVYPTVLDCTTAAPPVGKKKKKVTRNSVL